MKNKLLAGLVIFSVFGVSQTATAKPKPTLTPMQLQAIQSKEFETTKSILFASAMSVFQDLGYTIEGADVNTGFITARSPNKNTTSFFQAYAGMSTTGFTKATAFIEDYPNGRARIRLNFVLSKSASYQYGQQSSNETPILETQPYSIAWDKIDEALFVRGVITNSAPKAETSAAPNVEDANGTEPKK